MTKTRAAATRLAAVVTAWTLLGGGVAAAQMVENAAARETAEKSAASTTAVSDAAMEIRAGELAANPAKYFGKQVSVKADVATVYGSRVFTLDEERIGVSPDVLVLVPEHAPVSTTSTVTVNGEVREFVWTDLRRDFGWFDMSPGLDVIFRSRPVVVATSVRDVGGTELAGKAKQPTLDAVATRSRDYYGNFVSIEAPVGRVESPHVFTLDRGTGRPDVLVLVADPAASLSEGAKVTVQGVVRPFFMADLERDYDWFGLDQDLALKLQDRPVVVAESVRNAEGKEFVEADRGSDVSSAPPDEATAPKSPSP